MKWGLMFVNAGPFAEPELAGALARRAEEAGFESLWTVEHVVVPADYESEYPYSRSGRMPGGEDVPIPDPLVWLSYVAGMTERITLATGVMILPQRNPVVLAKEVATLDRLSGGRVVLGVGVGWLREEFDAVGVPFDGRGPRTDEYIEVLRRLWTEQEATHRGEHVHLERAKSFPKPVRPGGVPVVVGGHTPPAARRAGRLGDGFFPARGGPDRIRSLLDEVRDAAVEAGRDPEGIELTLAGEADPEAARRLAELGASRIVVAPPAFDVEGLDRVLGEWGERVVAPTADL